MPREPDTESGLADRVCSACGARYSADVRFCPSDGQVLRDADAPHRQLIGTVVADRYYIESELGSGGMGVVFLARHIYMERKCALKVLRPELLANPDAIKRFAREAKNACRIANRNVATIYDFGQVSEGLMYLAMEYIEGETLADVVAREGILSVARTTSIVAQVASGLHAAHELGIVHRDLKPENIMVVRGSGSEDLVKVVDFGIARAVRDELQQVTGSSVMLGTPAYMSPEQVSGEETDCRTDIYALALITYTLLTGALPFGSSHTDVLLRFLQEPRALADLSSGIAWPDELQSVLSVALSSSPGDRQQSIQEFSRQFIEAVQRWQPIETPILTPATRFDADPPFPSDERAIDYADNARAPVVAIESDRSSTRRFWIVGAVTAFAGAAGLFVVLSQGIWKPSAPPPSKPAESAALVAPTLDTAKRAEVIEQAPATATSQHLPLASHDAPKTGGSADGQRVENSPRPSDAQREAGGSGPAPQQQSSASPETASAPSTPLTPPRLTGLLRLGTPEAQGAALYVNDDFRGVLHGLRTITVPVGLVRLRLHLDQCEDWDTTVSIHGADTVAIGRRQPICRP